MDFCRRNPKECDKGSFLYNFHNEPVSNVITFHTIAVALITWVLSSYYKLSLWESLGLFITLIGISIYVHNLFGMPTAEGRFFGIYPK